MKSFLPKSFLLLFISLNISYIMDNRELFVDDEFYNFLIPTLESLKHGDLDTVFYNFYPGQRTESNQKIIKELSELLNDTDSLQIKLLHEGNISLYNEKIRRRYINPNDTSFYHLWSYTSEIKTSNNWILLQSQIIDGSKFDYLFNVSYQVFNQSLSQRNQFNIKNISVSKFMMTLLLIVVFIFCILSIYYIFKYPFKFKFLWVFFILWGFIIRIHIPLGLENVRIEPAIFTLPIIFIFKINNLSPYYITMGIPLGAIIVFIKTQKLKK